MVFPSRQPWLVTAIAAVALFLCAAPAFAISNGTPDGNAHPYVGMTATGDERLAGCSGFYAGPRLGAPGQGVFVTAGHCVAGLIEQAIPASDVWVSFESTFSIDPNTFSVTAASWHQASAYAIDPMFGARRSAPRDYGVIVLADAPALPAVQLPTQGLLDTLAANGSLGPDTRFDNVGYGVIPNRTGRFEITLPSARMRSTSRFQSLTPSFLNLLMNSRPNDPIGGSCFGDSGGPKLIQNTNRVVALQTGGDAICRAHSYSQRLDIRDAQAFLAGYVAP